MFKKGNIPWNKGKTGVFINRKISDKQKETLRYWAKQPKPWQRTIKERPCPVCGKIFKPKNMKGKHCSLECSLKNRPKKGLWKVCLNCGTKYYVSQTFKNSKYCSRKCQHEGQKIEESILELKCKGCGKVYYRPRSSLNGRGSSFCTKNCMNEYQKKKYYKNKKKGKSTNSKMKKQLWDIFSQYIRQRDKGVCISCGKVDYWRKTDAGHYIPRTAGMSLYFDERNVNCQCTYCNGWMHGNLSKYAIALMKKYGKGILEELDEKRKTVLRISISDSKH